MKGLPSVILALCIGFMSLAYADSEAEREAEILLDSMGMELVLMQSISQMVDIQAQQNPALEPFKGVMMEFFEKHMSWSSLKPEFLRIYSTEFTVEELRDMNEFYATETGKKAIAKLPSLMEQGAQIGARRVQDNMAELQEMVEAESQRLKASGNK